jgi:F-type H+-transporting ATPase subunit epsilon
MSMTLRIFLPAQIAVEEEGIERVRGEGVTGSFTLLPRHVDFVAPLAPGLLSFSRGEEEDQFVAINGGILVKEGGEIMISTTAATRGTEAEKLSEEVEAFYDRMTEREKQARLALRKMEADFVRRFTEAATA